MQKDRGTVPEDTGSIQAGTHPLCRQCSQTLQYDISLRYKELPQRVPGTVPYIQQNLGLQKNNNLRFLQLARRRGIHNQKPCPQDTTNQIREDSQESYEPDGFGKDKIGPQDTEGKGCDRTAVLHWMQGIRANHAESVRHQFRNQGSVHSW